MKLRALCLLLFLMMAARLVSAQIPVTDDVHHRGANEEFRFGHRDRGAKLDRVGISQQRFRFGRLHRERIRPL
jgi:hypothetical protein